MAPAPRSRSGGGAALANAADPSGDHVHVKADLADDITGNADHAEAVAELAHRGEQPGRVREFAGRFPRVPRDHEQLAHARGVETEQHLLEVRPVADEPSGQVRHRRIPG
jgi:hypothetical protein